MKDIPEYKNRNPRSILLKMNHYDSTGRIYKALSWIDFAKENNNVSALEYAALEVRLGIEQLIFEQLIIGVGSSLDKDDYNKCTGNAKKMSQIILRLVPAYEKLINFTIAIAPKSIPITKWDNRSLIEYSGKVSKYLHWSGGLDVTVQSKQWLEQGIELVSDIANRLWQKMITGNTGVIVIDKLEPEIAELWFSYCDGKISLEDVTKEVDILEPILIQRLKDNKD
ncbi:hypothetical protein ACEUDN_05080 [Aeromonas hydrophila]|uniref:hypothetical protein n=1 Tax=Aeromonas hydrophila TaxID=644 RepID=UPI0022AECC09|nr:hypothetical protein [Aeromonas hydrophila]ELB2789894.1 hypothetical protein [Aeromonas hydrophila]MCZ4332607.1 hypothetical protein [Aeromonas hydrophila]